MIITPRHPIFNLTLFQQSFVERAEADPTFAHWVELHVPDNETPRNMGPICLLWYDTDERLHAARLGQHKVLAEVCI